MFSFRRFLKVFAFTLPVFAMVGAIYLITRPNGVFDTRKMAADNSFNKFRTVDVATQSVGNYIDEGKPALLTVAGEGKVKAAPEIVKFNISYTSTSSGKSTAEAIANAKTIKDSIISLLTSSYGVDLSDIQVSAPSIVQTGTSPDIKYQSVNSLTVTLKRLADLERVIAKIYDMGPVSVSNIIFTTNNPRDLEDKAIASAIADGQLRAVKMADSTGSKLGRLVSMTGQQTQAVGTTTYDSNQTGGTGSAPGQIEIVRTVTLVYELK